jgi:hypothetical protein
MEKQKCEYLSPISEISEAIRKKGLPRGVKGCRRPGENVDHLCDFREVTNSTQYPHTRLQNGEISNEKFLELMFGS